RLQYRNAPRSWLSDAQKTTSTASGRGALPPWRSAHGRQAPDRFRRHLAGGPRRWSKTTPAISSTPAWRTLATSGVRKLHNGSLLSINKRKEPVRAGSFRIATIAGIPIRLHFTFLLFIVWVGVIAQNTNSPQLIALIPAIFACIILHELGHALVARRFGIKTRDITLYLLGGVAFIDGRPTPSQELQIALAGPLVNVVIAIILFPFVLA